MQEREVQDKDRETNALKNNYQSPPLSPTMDVSTLSTRYLPLPLSLSPFKQPTNLLGIIKNRTMKSSSLDSEEREKPREIFLEFDSKSLKYRV